MKPSKCCGLGYVLEGSAQASSPLRTPEAPGRSEGLATALGLMSASLTDNFSDLQSGSVSWQHPRLGTVLSVQETVMPGLGQALVHALEVHLTEPRVFKVSKPRLLLPLISSL